MFKNKIEAGPLIASIVIFVCLYVACVDLFRYHFSIRTVAIVISFLASMKLYDILVEVIKLF